MWPGQSRVPPPAYMGVPNPVVGAYQSGQPPLLPDPQWATFQDYQLEQHFSQMSFRQPPPFRPQGPPMTTQPAGQPQTNATGIPSLFDIRVPRPIHLRSPRMTVQPQLQQQQQPRAPYHQPPMVNTSVPPPRITLLQKPRPTRIEPTTPPAAPLVVEPQQTEPEEVEEEPAEVKEPEPEIKVMAILKRPASMPSNMSLSGSDPSENAVEDPVQSLKKREEEYANLRLRILGSTGVDESS